MTLPPEYAPFITEPGDATDVSYTDINQGQLGDCYFLSALGELAMLHPDDIKNMIHDNGDGTLDVRLYLTYGHSTLDSNLEAHTNLGVHPELFTVSEANLLGTGLQGTGLISPYVGGQWELWPQIIETAYSEARGGAQAIGTGGSASVGYSVLSGNAYSRLWHTQITQDLLTTAWANGNSIVFDTRSNNSPYSLVAPHAYMYDGLTTIDGNVCVLLKNPWGYYSPSPIPLSVIQDDASDFSDIEISAYGPPVQHAAPSPDSIALNLSRGSDGNDPQFAVTIDGIVQGSYEGSAFKSAGNFDEINLVEGISPGSHTVSIQLLNPGEATSLYLNSLSYQGQTIAENAQITNDTPLNFTIGQPIAPEPGKIVVNVSDDSYQGSAEFTVAVDGISNNRVYTATAEHDLGQSLPITLDGDYEPGQHTVAVTFLNDLGDNSAGYHTGLDRNLYVDSISFQGQTTPQYDRFDTNGTQNFTIGTPIASPSDQIALNVSEEAYNGDAQFTATVDGVDTGAIYTATANGWRGEDSEVLLKGYYGPGQHAVTVSFVNYAVGPSGPGYGEERGLNIDDISFQGETTPINRRFLGDSSQNFVVGTPIAIANGQIALSVSEDAEYGDAQFTVAVDGVSNGQVYTASAWHEPNYRNSRDTTAQVVLDGSYWPGQHSVAVSFINNDPDNAPARHLYVDSISYQGQTTAENADFSLDATQSFSVGEAATPDPVTSLDPTPVTPAPVDPASVISIPADPVVPAPITSTLIDPIVTSAPADPTPVTPTPIVPVDPSPISPLLIVPADPTPVTPAPIVPVDPAPVAPLANQLLLNIAEDAYLGDAQFTVSVDGKQYGGVQTVTAQRGGGQEVAIGGDFGTGPHTVSVDFVNDAWGGTADTDRNLLVNSITLDGVTTQENATQWSGGSVDYRLAASAPDRNDGAASSAPDGVNVQLATLVQAMASFNGSGAAFNAQSSVTNWNDNHETMLAAASG